MVFGGLSALWRKKPTSIVNTHKTNNGQNARRLTYKLNRNPNMYNIQQAVGPKQRTWSQYLSQTNENRIAAAQKKSMKARINTSNLAGRTQAARHAAVEYKQLGCDKLDATIKAGKTTWTNRAGAVLSLGLRGATMHADEIAVQRMVAADRSALEQLKAVKDKIWRTYAIIIEKARETGEAEGVEALIETRKKRIASIEARIKEAEAIMKDNANRAFATQKAFEKAHEAAEKLATEQQKNSKLAPEISKILKEATDELESDIAKRNGNRGGPAAGSMTKNNANKKKNAVAQARGIATNQNKILANNLTKAREAAKAKPNSQTAKKRVATLEAKNAAIKAQLARVQASAKAAAAAVNNSSLSGLPELTRESPVPTAPLPPAGNSTPPSTARPRSGSDPEEPKLTANNVKTTLRKLPIKELEGRLRKLGVNFSNVKEKNELADRLYNAEKTSTQQFLNGVD